MNKPSLQGKKKIPLIGFNMMQRYLDDLKHHFGEICHFFYDQMGGRVVGVCWRDPDALFESTPFKVALSPYTYPTSADTIKTNVESILAQFKELGKGLVKKIYAKKVNVIKGA